MNDFQFFCFIGNLSCIAYASNAITSVGVQTFCIPELVFYEQVFTFIKVFKEVHEVKSAYIDQGALQKWIKIGSDHRSLTLCSHWSM